LLSKLNKNRNGLVDRIEKNVFKEMIAEYDKLYLKVKILIESTIYYLMIIYKYYDVIKKIDFKDI
jgi:hypothetical protein